MKHDPGALTDMVSLCRAYYIRNNVELKSINDFETSYRPTEAIHYYTKYSFVFRQINRAFRCEDIELIFKFRVYITDLHQDIVQRATSKLISYSYVRLYRGKKLSIIDLQQLYDNKNKLISINGFLSTTEDIEIAKIFAGVGHRQEGYESAVFKLCIDENTMTRSPFADIRKDSIHQDELEVLFTIGSVWLLEKMEQIDDYWMIELQSCSDLDSRLTKIRDMPDGCNFLSIGNILRELGEYSNARNFYDRMLEEPMLDDETRAVIYYNIGIWAEKQNLHNDTLTNLLKVEDWISKTAIQSNPQSYNSQIPLHHNRLPSKLQILRQIGQVYVKKGDYKTARIFYTRALNEHDDSTDKAKAYNHYGLLEFIQGNFKEAHYYFSEAVRLGEGDKLVEHFQQNLKTVNNLLKTL
jgi:tetratricopeptide (TPR) repeat protein